MTALKNYEEIDVHAVEGFRHLLAQQLPYGASFTLLIWPETGNGFHHLINANRREAITRLREAADILERRGTLPQSEFR